MEGHRPFRPDQFVIKDELVPFRCGVEANLGFSFAYADGDVIASRATTTIFEMTVRRLRLHLEIDGMIAVHSARALHTAMGGIEGVTMAQVSMGRAELHYVGAADDIELRNALGPVVDAAGLHMRDIRIEADRQLPLVGNES